MTLASPTDRSFSAWLLLVQNGQGSAHEVALRVHPGREVARAEELALGLLRYNGRPADLATHDSALCGLRMLARTFKDEASFRPQSFSGWHFSTGADITNVTGTSDQLLLAMCTYLACMARLEGKVRGARTKPSGPFAATGTIDALGRVGHVDQVPAKVDAAILTLPPGSIIFVPAANWADVTAKHFGDADLRGSRIVRVAHLNDALQELGVTAHGFWANPPWRALERYELQHHPIYFGRSQEVKAFTNLLLLREVAHDPEGQPRPGGLIVAASGTGKSSFMLAGVLPYLRTLPEGQHKPLQYTVWRPRDAMVTGSADEAAMARSVLKNWCTTDDVNAAGLVGIEQQAEVQGLQSSSKPAGPITLAALPEWLAPALNPGRRTVWVVDQLEELFTLGFSREVRIALAGLLGQLQQLGVWVIATLRTEYLPEYQQLLDDDRRPVLMEVFGALQYSLPPVSNAGLEDVIRGPAAAAGLSFSQSDDQDAPPLDKVIFAASRNESAPLLGYAMHEVWSNACKALAARREAGLPKELSFADYRQLGDTDSIGINGVLGRVADEAFARLEPNAQAELPRLLEALSTTVNAVGQKMETSRPCSMDEWKPGTPGGQLVQALKTAGLLLYEGGTVGSDTQVRVAHELLFVHWKTARDQLVELRKNRPFLDYLKTRRLKWMETSQDEDLLTSAADLEQAEKIRELLAQRPDRADLLSYVDLSARAEEARRERAAQQQRESRARWAAAFGVAAALAIGLAVALLNVRESRDLAIQKEAEAVEATTRARAAANAERSARKDADTEKVRAMNAAASATNSARDAFEARGEAQDRARQAVLARKAAEAERDRAVEQQVRTIAALAATESSRGDHMTAIAAILESTKLLTGRLGLPGESETVLLRALLMNREERVLSGHLAGVSQAVFSPDGKRLVTVSGENTAMLWDLQGERPTAVMLVGHRDRVVHANFGPDGKWLVTASRDHTARLWFLSGERPTAVVLEGHRSPVRHAVFSPDGKLLVTSSSDSTARLWNLQEERPTAVVLEGHQTSVSHAAFSFDGKRLVTASDDSTARLWDLQVERPAAVVLEGHLGSVNRVAFSPDGKRLVTASQDHTARLWNLQGGRPTAVVLEGHRDWVSHAAFSPDGKRLVTASRDNTARLWDLERERPTAVVLEGHRGGVLHAAFSPDGKRLVTASIDFTARLWDLERERPTAEVLDGHRGRVNHVTFSPDGKRLVTASDDSTARLWDMQSARPAALELEGHRDRVLQAAFSPDSKRLVTVSQDNTARLWDMRGEHPSALVLAERFWGMKHAAFSPDGKRLVAVSGGDHTPMLWDLRGRRPTALVLEGHRSSLSHAAFSPDGKRLVTTSYDDTARLWDLEGERPIAVVLEGHSRGATHAAFSPDGKGLVTVSGDGIVRLWDLRAEPPMVVVLEGHRSSVRHAAFSPDGSQLVTISWDDHTPRLWDLRGERPTAVVLEGHLDRVIHVAFSPDGKRLATASIDNTARLWNLQGERPTAVVLEGHRSFVWHLAFSPDGKWLSTASGDNTARLWNLRGERPMAVVLEGHLDSVKHVSFSPDGKRLVTASNDNTARLWSVESGDELLRRAQRVQTRCLTETQRAAFGLPTERGVEGVVSQTPPC